MAHKDKDSLFALDPIDLNYEEEVIEEAEINKIPTEEISKTDSYQNLKNSLTKRSIGLYILKLLQKAPKYGYELKEAINEEFSVITSQISSSRISTSQIATYKALYKLNDDGLITCRIIEPIGHRSRKYYFITPMGLKLLIEARNFLKQTYSLLFGRLSGNQDDIE